MSRARHIHKLAKFEAACEKCGVLSVCHAEDFDDALIWFENAGWVNEGEFILCPDCVDGYLKEMRVNK